MLPTIKLRDIKLEKGQITIGTLITETMYEGSVAGEWLGGKYLQYAMLKIEQKLNGTTTFIDYNLSNLSQSQVIETVVNGDGTDSKNYYVQHIFLPAATLYPIVDLSYTFTVTLDLKTLLYQHMLGFTLAKLKPEVLQKFSTAPITTVVMKESEYQSGINIQDFDEPSSVVEQRMLDYTLYNGMSYFPKSTLISINPERVGGFFSQLFVSHAELGDVRAAFFVSLNNVLLEYSSYKSLLMSSDEILKAALERSKVVRLCLKRYRKGMEELFPPVTVATTDQNSHMSNTASLKESSIAVSNRNVGIKAYEFVDSQVSDLTGGEYWYRIEMDIEDGGVAILTEQRTKLQGAVRLLRSDLALALSSSSYVDSEGYFTQAYAKQSVSDWKSVVADYIQTLRLMTTVSNENAAMLASALTMMVDPATGNTGSVEWFVRVIEETIGSLDSLNRFQRIQLTYDFVNETVHPTDVTKPALVYFAAQDSDGLHALNERTLTTLLLTDQREAAIEPKAFKFNEKSYESRVAAINFSELALELAVQNVGHDDLASWASSIGLSFAFMEDGALQTSEKAAYNENALEKPLLELPVGPYVNVFVGSLLKLPRSYFDLLRQYGLTKVVEVLTDFKVGQNRTELRAPKWQPYTQALHNTMSPNGKLLCRLTSSNASNGITIYDQYFLVE